MSLWEWWAWTNVVSGLAMAALALLLLAANPRKDWNRLFALFAGFWGVQIVAANAARLVPTEALARFAGEASLAFLIPLPFFAAAFASSFAAGRVSAGAAVAFLAPALVSLGLLFLAPALLLDRVQPNDAEGGYSLVWGPAFPALVVAPLYASLFYALFLLVRRLASAEGVIESRRVAFVLAAIGVFVAFNIPVQLVRFGTGQATEAPGRAFEGLTISAVMLVGLVLLAFVALRLRRLEKPEARGALVAIGIATLLGFLVDAAPALLGVRVELVGIVRVVSVAMIVYAIARYQLFDIDLRVKHAMTAVAALVAAGAVAAAVWVLVRGLGATPTLRGWLVGAGALVALVPLWRVARSVADRVAPRVSREGDHLYLRKLEVYRAAVESRAPESALAHLREKLGLTQRDHDVVVNLALARAEGAVAPDLRPGGVAFGKYAIDSVLGEGGYGRVFLARDRILQRPVVIKELQARWRGNASVVKTFLREAQIAGRLNHPNIVSVLEVERHGEDHYIVMEHMAGGSLEERLRGGSLPPAEAARVARAVLSALDAAHAQGVVHRDVKPANILLGAHGEVKLTDFGIAQMSGDDPQRTISGLTMGGAGAGTLQYMSPEQARGRPLDARSDLYAVGALLYRMLTGRPHVDLEGLDEFSARAAVADAPAPPAPPGVLGAAAAKALAPDPAQRFPTARAFLEALGAAEVNPVVERS
ncbi:MAG TPA: serine/threonine-protein kinase [Candidatus Thermoplasmatota archaeon]|nr:serine/threonine-protein kinase [Candidatus Thermoplasmatota archaeon]